ncbi:MOS1T transposase, partial [Pseudoatta argentina]
MHNEHLPKRFEMEQEMEYERWRSATGANRSFKSGFEADYCWSNNNDRDDGTTASTAEKKRFFAPNRDWRTIIQSVENRGVSPAMHPVKRPLYAQRHDKVILLHDNARPHVAKPVKTYLETLKWEVLPHPLYSPDIHAGRDMDKRVLPLESEMLLGEFVLAIVDIVW